MWCYKTLVFRVPYLKKKKRAASVNLPGSHYTIYYKHVSLYQKGQNNVCWTSVLYDFKDICLEYNFKITHIKDSGDKSPLRKCWEATRYLAVSVSPPAPRWPCARKEARKWDKSYLVSGHCTRVSPPFALCTYLPSATIPVLTQIIIWGNV